MSAATKLQNPNERRAPSERDRTIYLLHKAQRFKQKFGHEPGLDALQAYNGVRALAQAVTQSGKVDRKRNNEELALLDADYKTFLDTGLSFASDHTIKYDNNIVLKVDGGTFVVENTLRSDR